MYKLWPEMSASKFPMVRSHRYRLNNSTYAVKLGREIGEQIFNKWYTCNNISTSKDPNLLYRLQIYFSLHTSCMADVPVESETSAASSGGYIPRPWLTRLYTQCQLIARHSPKSHQSAEVWQGIWDIIIYIENIIMWSKYWNWPFHHSNYIFNHTKACGIKWNLPIKLHGFYNHTFK